jgi:hypothetical protein
VQIIDARDTTNHEYGQGRTGGIERHCDN